MAALIGDNEIAHSRSLKFDFEISLKEKEDERYRLLQSQGYTRPDVISYSGRGKHSIVCRHWLRGMCMKGDFCDFLHQLSYNRMPVCRPFSKYGYCGDLRRGYCPYKHVEDDSGSGADNIIDETSGPLSYGAIPGKAPSIATDENNKSTISGSECINYFLGFCKLGNRCKKKHVYRDRIDVPDVLPDWFLTTILSDISIFPKVPYDSELGHKLREFNGLLQSLGVTRSFGVDGGIYSTTLSSKLSQRDSWVAVSRQGGKGWCDNSNAGSWNNSSNSTVESWSKIGCGIPDLDSIEGVQYSKNDSIRVFTIKSISMKNICLSCEYSVWATSKTNSRRLSDAFRSTNHVVLVFSGNESGGFQGYARMMSMPINYLYQGLWGPFSDRLASNFRIHWIKKCKLPFDKVSFILNPLNDDLPLKKSRDGQELPVDVGEVLCHKMYESPDVVLADPSTS